MDHGEERIEDAAERERVRRQARRVHAKALAFAALLTVVALLLPTEWEPGD